MTINLINAVSFVYRKNYVKIIRKFEKRADEWLLIRSR